VSASDRETVLVALVLVVFLPPPPRPDTDGGCSCTSRSILEPEAPPEAKENRTRTGARGLPARAQGRSCRVRAGRRVVEKQGRRAHRRGARDGSPAYLRPMSGDLKLWAAGLLKPGWADAQVSGLAGGRSPLLVRGPAVRPAVRRVHRRGVARVRRGTEVSIHGCVSPRMTRVRSDAIRAEATC